MVLIRISFGGVSAVFVEFSSVFQAIPVRARKITLTGCTVFKSITLTNGRGLTLVRPAPW
jgi:hypothetical protein